MQAFDLWREKGGNINATDRHGRTIGHYAALGAKTMGGRPLEVLTEWVRRGGDVNAVDNDSRTIGHVVAAELRPADALTVLEKWVGRGGDLFAKDGAGKTVENILKSRSSDRFDRMRLEKLLNEARR